MFPRSVLVVFLGVVLLLRCSTAVLMFHYSVVFRLLRQCSVVCSPRVFRCSASVPVFRSSVFRCSWFYSMPRKMLVTSQLSRNKLFVLVIVVKVYTESDFKVSWYCPYLIDFFTYFQIFCPGW